MNEAKALLVRAIEAARRMGVRRFWRKAPPPTNLRAPDGSVEAIDAAARYDLSVGLGYLRALADVGLRPAGLRTLEIGPGPAFGSSLTLAAFGAKPAVADRWLANWRDNYEPAYLARLADLLASTGGADPAPVRALLSAGRYLDEAIALISEPAETLGDDYPAQFDAVFSNAVLEHVRDLDQSIASVAASMRSGAFGFHQIDYRDHRDFERPLEHLMFSASKWRDLTGSVHMEYGTQRRPPDYARAFEAAGLEIIQYVSTGEADKLYTQDLARRLARASASPFCGVEAWELSDLSGFFVVRRR